MLLSRLSPSFSNRWVHLDTVSRQIFGDFQETQFSGSKMEIHVHLKKAFPGGIGNVCMYQNKSYRIILPGAFRDLHEVFAEVPEDSRVLSERRLWFPSSDHLQTWLILSGTTWSRQYNESTMV